MNAVRDSWGCTWADLHGREPDEIVADAIAALSFGQKRERWCDWDCARNTQFRPKTTLTFRAWLAERITEELP